MKKTMTTVMVLVSLLIFTACNKPNTNNNGSVPIEQQSRKGVLVTSVLVAQVGDFVLDEQGRKYIKITAADVTDDRNISRAEIWERIDPVDKKHWYTPSLSSFVWIDQPIIFNSIFRMEGEDYPVF